MVKIFKFNSYSIKCLPVNNRKQRRMFDFLHNGTTYIHITVGWRHFFCVSLTLRKQISNPLQRAWTVKPNDNRNKSINRLRSLFKSISLSAKMVFILFWFLFVTYTTNKISNKCTQLTARARRIGERERKRKHYDVTNLGHSIHIYFMCHSMSRFITYLCGPGAFSILLALVIWPGDHLLALFIT